MKSSQILNLVLAVALVIVVIKTAVSSGDEKCDTKCSDASMGAIEAIMTRTSVRSYTSQSVEADKIETMLRAGMAAPTGGNKQPWRFIVVDDKSIIEQFPGIVSGAKMAANAPLAIVVCGVPAEGMLEYWVQDTSAATENILLSAHALGLGAVWCGVYPDSNGRLAGVQKLLNIPEDIIPLNVIVMGYPDSEPAIKDKWMPEKVSYNKFGNR